MCVDKDVLHQSFFLYMQLFSIQRCIRSCVLSAVNLFKKYIKKSCQLKMNLKFNSKFLEYQHCQKLYDNRWVVGGGRGMLEIT